MGKWQKQDVLKWKINVYDALKMLMEGRLSFQNLTFLDWMKADYAQDVNRNYCESKAWESRHMGLIRIIHNSNVIIRRKIK